MNRKKFIALMAGVPITFFGIKKLIDAWSNEPLARNSIIDTSGVQIDTIMANQPIIKTDSTIHEKQEQKAKKNSMSEKLMPALFLGHGSPMNAIEENDFVKTFRSIGQSLPKPKAILCVSAHWETKGTLVTAMPTPRTIHDFGGFPKELYEINYPAPGSPECAEKVKQEVQKTEIGLDYQWGLDHGAWTVIKHLYPMADVPVFQMSIDYSKPAQYHYELATELQQFRKRGVLIIGSGNMVHNLGMVAWNKLQEPEYGYDWALEANEKMKSFIKTSNHASLINFKAQGKAFELSIPTPEHYLPLLYVLGLKNDKDDVKIFNDKAIGGSLTMTSVGVGELSV